MKQKQLNKQLKHAKLSELENDANIMNDYNTAYYNYYKDETFIDTDTHKSRKQMLLSKLKCVHCQSNYFNNGTCINFNNCTFLCSSCSDKLNEKDEQPHDETPKKDTLVIGENKSSNEDNIVYLTNGYKTIKCKAEHCLLYTDFVLLD
jgi:hypothetical protein